MPPAPLVDRLLHVVDGLQELLPSLRAGQATAAATAALLAHLDGTLTPNVAPAVTTASPVVVHQVVSDVIELPSSRVDEIVRSVGVSAASTLRLGRVLGERLGGDPETIAEYRDLSRSIRHLHEKAVRARMVPISSITGRLHRAVRDVARSRDKQVEWQVVGDETELDRARPATTRRSVAAHRAQRGRSRHRDPRRAEGRGKARQGDRPIHRRAGRLRRGDLRDRRRSGISIDKLRDEAARQGIDASSLDDGEVRDLIFRSGVSTAAELSQTSGRGVGLDVVRASVERLRGRVDLASTHGSGTEFRIVVPITAAVVPCLLVEAGGQRLALPMTSIVSTQAPDASTITRAQGVRRIWVGSAVVPLASLSDRVGLSAHDDGPIVVVAAGDRIAAYQVAALVGQRDVMVTSLGPFVPQLPMVAGASVEADGSVLIVLDGAALARSTHLAAAPAAPSVNAETPEPARAASVLVADDALPIRELQRSILENAGYRVVVAEDGADALAALGRDRVDLVLTDVEMPRMNGFDLTRAIRSDPRLANLPVVIVSSRGSPEDQQAGLDAGADVYIVKEAFGEASLLSTVEQLLGRAS